MLAVVLLLAGALPGPAALAQTPADGGCEFGLVLSGGGARGVAHIGVLEVLEEHGIVPDCIVGASMGAIVGALYAAGHDLGEIEGILRTLSWRTVYAEPENRASQPVLHRLESQRAALRVGLVSGGPRLPTAVLNDSRVNRLLIEKLAPANYRAGRDFAALPIPFRTLGADLVTGGRVVLAQGDLARAVRASMSVPLAYAPVPWGEAMLMDGGMVDNLPVRLAEEMGATFTLAVDVSTPVEPTVQPDLFGVTKRIIDLLYVANNEEFARPADVTIHPDIGEHSFADYSGMQELIEAGRKAALEALGRIPERFRSRRRRPPDDHSLGEPPPVLDRIEVEGLHYLTADILVRELGWHTGERLRLQDLTDGLDRIYATGLVQGAWIDLRPEEPGHAVAVVTASEEYRTTVDFGLAYQSDDQVQGFARVETRNLLGTGERLRLGGYASSRDVFGSIGLRGAHLFGSSLGYDFAVEIHDEKPEVFAPGGRRITRADFHRRHARFYLDVPFGTKHLLEAGIRFGSVTTRERLGLPYPEHERQHSVLVGRYVWDDLDSLVLPEHGRFVRVLAEHDLPALGADSRYTLVDVFARGARALGPVVLEGRLRYGYSDGDLPLYEQFRIGGPELVPGFDRDEMWGEQALAASITLGVDPFSLVRLRLRGGLGNAWRRPRDISFASALWGIGVGATVATPIGPVEFDYGWGEGGRNAFYFALGWQSHDPRQVTR